jgi:hypothetical protein
MPENRFGGVNPQPLYNVTGRMNRGEAPQAPQFQAPSAGVSKNFGAGDMPNNAAGTQGGFGANLMQSVIYGQGPISLYGNRGMGGGRRGGRRGGRGGGGGNDGGDTNSNNTTFVGGGFGEGSGNTYNQQGLGGQNQNAFNNNSGGAGDAPQAQPAPQSTKPKRVVTPAQQAARKTRDQQNRSGARTPVARGPRQKPAVAGAATYSGNTSAPTIQANNTDARQVNNYAGASTPPATQQSAGPGQPGAPAISFGSVTGASLGKPAKIGPTKVGKK